MVRYTKKEKEQIISEFESSQETRAGFCKRKKLGLSTLQRWRMQYNQVKSEGIHFLPVITTETKHQEIVELKMPKGISLRFSASTAAHYIADIIKAIAW